MCTAGFERKLENAASHVNTATVEIQEAEDFSSPNTDLVNYSNKSHHHVFQLYITGFKCNQVTPV